MLGRWGDVRSDRAGGTVLDRTLAGRICVVGNCEKLVHSKTSQASDVNSIPIARSINPVDAVGFTGP